MALNKPRRPLIFGWLAILAISALFFIFGRRDIDLTCRRPGPGAPPTCQVSESFALGLYTRQTTVEQATGVSFQVRRTTSPDSGSPAAGTVILATPGGEAPGNRVSGNFAEGAKRELIGKMQEFLDRPESLELRHHARLSSLSGHLSVVGLAGLVFLLLAVIRYQLRTRRLR